MAFIDAHAHLADRPGAREKLLKSMDALGIAQTIVVCGGTVSPYELSRRLAHGGEHETKVDNAVLLEQCQTSGGRLLPFFFADPHQGPLEYERTGRAYFGLKLGPAVHGVPLLDPRYTDFVKVAATFSHAVYLHCLDRPGFRVEDFCELARTFPGTKFILGHAGIGQADFRALELIEGLANTYLETSGGFSMMVREAVKRLGATRVMFGSEFPLQEPSVEVAKMRALDLPDGEFQTLMRGTILSLLEGRDLA